jgi:hypothetical protein
MVIMDLPGQVKRKLAKIDFRIAGSGLADNAVPRMGASSIRQVFIISYGSTSQIILPAVLE